MCSLCSWVFFGEGWCWKKHPWGSQRIFIYTFFLPLVSTPPSHCAHFKQAAIQHPHRVETLQSTSLIDIMMNDETKPWGMRILNHFEGSSAQDSNTPTYNIRVFWIVNMIFISVMLAILVWCACGGPWRVCRYTSPGSSSDQVYREHISPQHFRQDQDKKETPEQRRTKLLQSFHRNKVHLVSR
jgi:hypothetical protein